MYTIPETRQEAIEMFNRLLDDYVTWLPETEVTKYHMFIGALTECSDEEFDDYKIYDNDKLGECKLCDILFYDYNPCNGKCKNNLKQLFSKRWNE